MALDRREFLTPRNTLIKNAALFLLLAAVVGLYIAVADEPEWWAGPLTGFLLLFSGAEILAIFKPLKFVIDEQGFHFEGWQLRAREKVRWDEVEGFVVGTVRARGRTTKFVAFNWREGSQKIGKVMKSANRLFGADRYIPMAWPVPHEAMVETLNDYRSRAVHSAGSSAQTPNPPAQP